MKCRNGISIVITTAMIVSLLPAIPVRGEEKDEGPTMIEVETVESDEGEEHNSYHTLSYEVDSVEDSQLYSTVPQLMNATHASAYDSRTRTEHCITSVKNQGSYGTCWAFAAMNSAESDGILDGRLSSTNADLSEAQLAYFFYHRMADSLGGTTGDVVSTSYNYLGIGGNHQLSTFALSSWISPADETAMPYEYISSYSSSNVTADMAYESSVAHLQNAYWVAMSDRDAIKTLIETYGSVATSYYSYIDNDNNPGNDYYHYTGGNCYYYYPFYASQNHAVSIVGWDDTISKDNFSVTVGGNIYTPANDGAWLIKNSYGTSWGKDGYFWISYEDLALLYTLTSSDTLTNNIAVAFDYESVDNYDNNYQYDGTVSLGQLQYRGKTSCYNANVFTTQTTEDLKAVGFYTTQPGMAYEIQVYRNVTDGSPMGTAVFSTPITGVEEYAGYHTVELPNVVELAEGETFSIAVRYISPSTDVAFLVDNSTNYGWISCTSANTSGQGYYSLDGASWYDCSDWFGANIRIKAFTDYRLESGEGTETIVPTTGISLNKTSCSLEKGKTYQLTATVTPSNATNQKVIWSSSDTTVATVSSTGVITAKKEGTTVITGKTVAGGHKATCTVTVTAPSSTPLPVYTQTQAFVARLYNKCLGREPETSGLNAWNEALVTKRNSGVEVGWGFVFSQEYKNKHTTNEEYVEMMYQVFLDRPSDPSGKAAWVDLLNQGVSREYVFYGFAHSQEYTNLCNSYGIERGSVTLTQPRDQNAELTKFVNRLYVKALERPGEEEGLNAWCNVLLSRAQSPEEVAECFINSYEFQSKNLSNEEYVKVLYRTFLGREYDQQGLDAWVAQLNRGVSRQEVLYGFSRSPEFARIMAQFGL